MAGEGDRSAEFRDEEGASPLGMGTQSEASGIQRRTGTRLGGAQVKREIEHKALLP